MDFARSIDPAGLVKGGTAISFLLSLSANSAPYNLPIFILGVYVQDNTDAVASLQTFTALLGVTIPTDLYWVLLGADLSWFAVLLSLVLIVLKVATFFIFFNALKQRGGQFNLGGPNLAGATVWAMPGGFTSNGRDGYQTVDDEPFVRNVRPGAPPSKPPAPPNLNDGPAAPAPPGGYQTV